MASLTSIFFTLALITPLLLILMKKLSKRNSFGRRNLPPSPPKIPIIGNLHQLGAKSPHKKLLQLSRKYGDLMLLQLGCVPTLVISSAKTAQEIFKNHDLAFSNRSSLYSLKKLVRNQAISFAPYGEYWREMKKIAVLELLTVKRVESFREVREHEVGFMMNEIQKSTTSPTPVNLSSLAFTVTNTIICLIAFGQESDPKFEQITSKLQSLAAEFNIADYFPMLKMINKINGVDKNIAKCTSELDTFLDKIIFEHRKKSEVENDIVDVLLKIEKDAHSSISLNTDHIKAILLDVFVAGSDTSASTIVWTMTELVRNPEVLEKLQHELREIGAGKEFIEEKELPKLTYLKLVIKESLRRHPPVPLLVPRETMETCNIGEKWVIPKKTRVIINDMALSLDPEYWEKPEAFWPERFSDGKIDFRGQHFGYLPFGTGRRTCPGINFAMAVVELALANLVFGYNWKLPEGMKVEDVDMEESVGITMHKKVPLCLVAKRAI